jgi:hypothetical protein
MMERISNCPNNRQEIKELISDFRDVDACTIVQLGGSPLFLFMAGSFIQGAMNKGNILFSHSESEQTRLSLMVLWLRRVYSNTWALYNHIPSGIMVLKRAASASLIMSLYLSNQVPT